MDQQTEASMEEIRYFIGGFAARPAIAPLPLRYAPHVPQSRRS